MSDLKINKFVDVKVPKRSGFDKSFRNLYTAPVGALVPILCDEVIPNTRVHLDVALNAQLPPLASDCFMNTDMCLESFFVPSRILYGGFDAWLTGDEIYDTAAGTYKKAGLPRLSISSANTNLHQCDPGTLADYLGYKFTSADTAFLSGKTGTTQYFNVFPFLAYHRVYNDWYLNRQVQREIFAKPSTSTGGTLYTCPWRIFNSNINLSLGSEFVDHSELGQLRYRNYGPDRFTCATPKAQLGDAQSVSFDTTAQTGSFSIASLRAANSLQMWLERNNLASFRLQDFVRTNYGANLKDGVAQRAIYLGSGRVNVYTKGIYQTTNANSGGNTVVPNNPFFTSVGAEFGDASANGVVKLVDDFTAQEPGYIVVMASLVPKAVYGTGVLRQNLRYNTSAGTQTDMANPILQNTGNEPIYTSELNAADAMLQPGQVFGYQPKFADWMQRDDEIHGKLRDGESLDSFAFQRNFTNGQAAINSSFLTISANCLDQVAAAQGGISGYGVWVDSYLNYKVSMPLAETSIPSLQDPAYEHGETVTVRRGGTRID